MPVLDRWVIENTMKFLAEQSPCIDKLQKCAINLSGASLSDPEFASFIDRCLQRYQVPPTCITFEVTETEAIRNPAEALQFYTRCTRTRLQGCPRRLRHGLGVVRLFTPIPFRRIENRRCVH